MSVSKSPTAHISVIEEEINWMNVDGQLKDDDVQKCVATIETELHKLRKIFERNQRSKDVSTDS